MRDKVNKRMLSDSKQRAYVGTPCTFTLLYFSKETYYMKGDILIYALTPYSDRSMKLGIQVSLLCQNIDYVMEYIAQVIGKSRCSINICWFNE